MAAFINQVVQDHVSKELSEIGMLTDYHEARISKTISRFISGPKGVRSASVNFERTWLERLLRRPPSKNSARGLDQVCSTIRERSVKRKDFRRWLRDPVFKELFEECCIETSTKHELFDVLDADMGGALRFDELVYGLLSLRGPITKTDIVGIKLKVCHMTQLLEELMHANSFAAPTSPIAGTSISRSL
eukprot:TRINITY_DN7887_c0_g1_i2.p1 TRINITY_DN7887_c0_g1~~TRINITY_DN7887_c0_g1_i2.p1  ORF type:complete len:221 (-),score=16.03 TRINITY_DN7887_c0_g1_i2:440-1006(-)